MAFRVGTLVLLSLLPSLAAAQTRDDGIRAFATGDYGTAAEILRPLAENSQPDHAARFIMAMLAYSGRGVAGNRVAACALFSSVAATTGPFSEPAAVMVRATRDQVSGRFDLCTEDAWRTLAPLVLARGARGVASAAAAGFVAAAHDDMGEAVRLTRQAGESDSVNDAPAQFLMAAAYQSGLAIMRDDLRACALYERATMDQLSPFAEPASFLVRALWQAHDNEWFEGCQRLANVGLDNRFEPATFALDLGYDVAWDLAGATITYRGARKRFPLPYGTRGAAFLPLTHTTLYTGQAHTKRDFVSMLIWERAESTWNLTWHLFEVTPTAIRRVGGAQALATRERRPTPNEVIDPETLVAVRVNAFGMAEWAVLDPAHPRTEAIESEEDLRAARDEEAARQAARRTWLAGVDYSARYDIARLPALRYIAEEGCSRFTVVGFSDDRAEAVVIRVDQDALGLKTGPVTIDLARAGAHASVAVHVFDRPVETSPFCTDVRIGEPLPETTWRAVSGVLTIDLSPPGATPRRRGLSRATVRLDGAEFVNASGKRVRQTTAIMLSALAGAVFG